MEKVFVLTLEHISEDNNDHKVLGAFPSMREAELAQADAREDVTKELQNDFTDDEIDVYSISGTNQVCACALYDFDNYYLDIIECELGKMKKAI